MSLGKCCMGKCRITTLHTCVNLNTI
jgi:hypothetical protein